MDVSVEIVLSLPVISIIVILFWILKCAEEIDCYDHATKITNKSAFT